MNPKELIIDDLEILRTFHDIQRNPPRYDISYNELHSLFPNVIKKILETDRFVMPKHVTHDILKDMFIYQCKRLEKRFTEDEQCSQTIETICMYLRKDPAFLTLSTGYDFDKGLFVHGKIGSGKTLIMKAMAELLKIFNYDDYTSMRRVSVSFEFVESWKISEQFVKSGFEVWDQSFNSKYYPLKSKALCIDDIGSEPIATHYSNTVNIVGSLLMDRYSEFKTKGPKESITHVTSNLNAKLLQDFYGERTFSRMKELFNDIVLPGSDRRH